MVKNDPKFKAYCRRRSTVKAKTMEEILADNRKKRAADFKAFCRPRGILSILKDNEYTTGGYSMCHYGSVPTVAMIQKRGDEFISIIKNPSIEVIPDEAA